MVSLHALHAYQSKLPGNFGMQGVPLGDPRTHANQIPPSARIPATIVDEIQGVIHGWLAESLLWSPGVPLSVSGWL
jgi:hypothetical protein